MAKVHVKTGDQVEVISGDDRGKSGKVLEVHPKANRVVVDGVNIQKKHARPTQTNPQGGIVEVPGPIAASNVAVICPNCKKATRVGRERGADGDVSRRCKRCGKLVD